MALINAAQASVKTVADPNASYESLYPLWTKSRAVCNGERFVKDLDGLVDTTAFTNMLIPFSPTMSQQQYNFYKAEAELPGITAEFAKMLVSGLLRKPPTFKLPDGVPEEATVWIRDQFGKDDSSLVAFLDEALLEELQTSRAWVFVDYPKIENSDDLTPEELKQVKPYPVITKAESIINWRVKHDKLGRVILDRLMIKGMVESFDENEFHPTFKETVWVHELDKDGKYQIRTFQEKADKTVVPVVNGVQLQQMQVGKTVFECIDTNTSILMNDERLTFIPAWPLNGSIDALEPMLTAIIDREIALYNKMSRRNHLLYGAATYTPVIMSDMSDDEFEKIVESGLGTWIRLRAEDKADVLKTPTEALQDMDRAIAAAYEEMAKLGIRMLTPETAQSGVALEIRNASQTARLGTLNSKVSSIMRKIICFMVNWRYDLELADSDLEFSLSEDFNPTPLGSDWLRLATEWYQQGLIPRSIWLTMLKQNDLLDSDYNDDAGQKEINADKIIQNSQMNSSVTDLLANQDKAPPRKPPQ